jgi:membrane dipeptidase
MSQINRRTFSFMAAASLLSTGVPARGQTALQKPYIADMHSHAGGVGPLRAGYNLRQAMEESGTCLLAWSLVDDAPWIGRTQRGVEQVSHPPPGELWTRFERVLRRMNGNLRTWNISRVLTPADVDAALAGSPHVVLASESANFLEGSLDRLPLVHALGLRHLQIVHYIDTPFGDLQTAAPRHTGMPEIARKLLTECSRLGILIDLAHCTPTFVEQALAATEQPMVWSHSWISRRGGQWNDHGYLARSLAPELAKKVAAHGGVIGLWVTRVRGDSSYPLYSVNSYADEILRMVDVIGPKAVGFGTDMEGTGPEPVLSNYQNLREVVNRLVQLGVPSQVLEDVCSGNYARVLKKALVP